MGHYTQMMWWSSFRVGCGFTMFQEDGWWKKLYTCNYGPGGNIILSQMYRRGSPCSACPAGTSCSLQYPGLCGKSSGGRAQLGAPRACFKCFALTCTAQMLLHSIKALKKKKKTIPEFNANDLVTKIMNCISGKYLLLLS